MKVFLSWSGDKSCAVAKALHGWLPYINAEIEPWMSNLDIGPGQRWSGEIAQRLQDTSFGIVCVTRDNQSEPWLNFEAGALAKQVDEARVVPLAIDLKPSDIKQPLGGFQGKEMTQDGLLEVLRSLNDACSHQVPDVVAACERNWPALQDQLDAIPEVTEAPPVRDPQDLLAEILTIVRTLQAQGSSPKLEDVARPFPLELEELARRTEHQQRMHRIAVIRAAEALLPAGSAVTAAGHHLIVVPLEPLTAEVVEQINDLAITSGFAGVRIEDINS